VITGTVKQEITFPVRRIAVSKSCPECGRIFDLLNSEDAEEFYYGHDCDYTMSDESFWQLHGKGLD
jgi:hypothetical protein